MSQKQRTPSIDPDSVRDQVKNSTPQGVVDVIVTQMERAADAKHRIEEEGLVVRDMRGAVIAHPAIRVEMDASKIICDLLAKNRGNFRP